MTILKVNQKKRKKERKKEKRKEKKRNSGSASLFFSEVFMKIRATTVDVNNSKPDCAAVTNYFMNFLFFGFSGVSLCPVHVSTELSPQQHL